MRSIPICLKTGEWLCLQFLQHFFLSLQVYVEMRKIVCTCSFLHGYSCTVNADLSAMPGTAYSQPIFIYRRSAFSYTRYIIVCCKRIFVCNDQRDIFIIAGHAPTINTSNWTKLKMLIHTRKFSKLAIQLTYIFKHKNIPKIYCIYCSQKNCILRPKKNWSTLFQIGPHGRLQDKQNCTSITSVNRIFRPISTMKERWRPYPTYSWKRCSVWLYFRSEATNEL